MKKIDSLLIFNLFIFITISIYLLFNFNILFNNSKYFFIYLTVFTSLSSAFFIYSIFFFNRNIKLIILICFYSLITALYLFEFYLSFVNEKIIFENSKKNKYEIVLDLRSQNEEAFLNINPSLFINSKEFNREYSIYPLGSISNIFTVQNNELGFNPIFKTDKFGFNNENIIYENKIENILIGDSFVEGCCVKNKDNISEILNKLEMNTLNLGKSGNGPLIEFATFLEYAPSIKPDRILWFYYPNDFKNLKNEIKSNTLKKYLIDENYSQNLIKRQDEIDNTLVNYITSKEKSYINKINEEKLDLLKNNWLIKNLKFTNTRIKLNLININNNFSDNNYLNEIDIFLNILLRTKKITESWNGELVFIYLPSIIQINNNKVNDFHKDFLKKIKNKNIKIINIKKELIDNFENPYSLLSNDTGGHFNVKGYKLIANKIYESLR